MQELTLQERARTALSELFAAGADKGDLAESVGASWRTVHRWSPDAPEADATAPTSIAHCRGILAYAKRWERLQQRAQQQAAAG